MSQPDENSFAPANISCAALDGIVRALSGRGGETEAEREAQADQFRTMILSFQPRDVVEMQLAGHAVLFTELLADSARDLLSGMDDTRKPRAIAGLISMGRLVLGNLDRLEKRGNRPYRTEVASAREDERAPAGVRAMDTERSGRTGHDPDAPPGGPSPAAVDATPAETAAPDRCDTNAETRAEPAADETSWLDEPFVQWLIETPADLARKSGLVAATEAEAPTQTADPDDDTWSAQAEAPPEPALPFQPEGYAPARTVPARTLPAGTLPARQMPARTLMDADASAGD